MTLQLKTNGAFAPVGGTVTGPTIIGPVPGTEHVHVDLVGAVPPYFANGADGTSGSGNGSASAWGRARKLSFQNDVTSIGNYAFLNWNSCQEIVWPVGGGLTFISRGAFRDWRQFAGILTLPSGLTSVDIDSFRYWSAATGLVFPSSLTDLSSASSCFDGWTSALSLVIPSTITALGTSNFSNWTAATLLDISAAMVSMGTQTFYNWTSLQTMICRATTPPTITTNTFQSMRAAAKIYVPDASVAAYKAATYWSARSAYIFGISTMP